MPARKITTFMHYLIWSNPMQMYQGMLYKTRDMLLTQMQFLPINKYCFKKISKVFIKNLSRNHYLPFETGITLHLSKSKLHSLKGYFVSVLFKIGPVLCIFLYVVNVFSQFYYSLPLEQGKFLLILFTNNLNTLVLCQFE